jgi:hypothetical protein
LTGGVAQAVEHLLCKHKDLSPNPSPMKKRKISQLVAYYNILASNDAVQFGIKPYMNEGLVSKKTAY